MNQSDLAKEIGVSLRTIQLYEKKNANIPIKNLTKIADFFDLSIAELYLQEVNESEATYTKRKPFTKKGSVFYPLDHGKHLVMVPLVLTEYQKAFLDDLARNSKSKNEFQTGFVLDFLPEEALRAFEITGDSMNNGNIEAIPNKAVVLGLKLEENALIKEDEHLWDKPYVLVCRDRIICKWVTGVDGQKKVMYCQNLNKSPEYQDFELALQDVLQVYKVVRKQL